MISNENLKNRDVYLNQLIAFQDKEPIKVVTGYYHLWLSIF